jgi:shikimate dehydrogenase
MVRITGTTKLAGIIGWPIEHSLSPVMHNAVYDELGLDWAYVPLAVEDEIGLRRVAAAIRALPFVGFNVTMPYKKAVLELCDEVATAASMAGAVNTVQVVDGRLVGYNTDGRGMLESLSEDAGFSPEGKRVVLLGSGGAAGAALVAFILGKSANVCVVSRDRTRAEDLVSRVAPQLKDADVCCLTFETAEESVRAADLVVNATPVGMRPGDESPVPGSWLSSRQVVLDMVYGGVGPTRLLTEARDAGAVALDGLGMLVGQGAIAVDIWNPDHERRTPRATMRRAAEVELERRARAGSAR